MTNPGAVTFEVPILDIDRAEVEAPSPHRIDVTATGLDLLAVLSPDGSGEEPSIRIIRHADRWRILLHVHGGDPVCWLDVFKGGKRGERGDFQLCDDNGDVIRD